MDERVFSIKINGVEESYKNAKRLVDILNLVTDVTAKISVETDKNTTSTQNSTKASKEKANALSEEEKAQKKLTETQAKANKEIEQSEIEQAKANIQLKERAKQLQNLAKLELAAKNTTAEFKAELALLNQKWDNVEVGTQAFEELTNEIEALNQKLKDSEFAKGTFSRNVGNYPKELNAVNQSFEKLGDGIHKTTENTKGMLSFFQAGIGIALIFGNGNSKLEKILANLGKVMAIVGALQQANNALVKSGTLLNVTKATVDTLVTKGIISQTIAQNALNVATKAFPLLAIIAGIAAVIGIIASFVDSTKDATNNTDAFSSSIDRLNWKMSDLKDNMEFTSKVMAAEGKTQREILEYQIKDLDRQRAEAWRRKVKAQKEGNDDERKRALEHYQNLSNDYKKATQYLKIYDIQTETDRKKRQEEDNKQASEKAKAAREAQGKEALAYSKRINDELSNERLKSIKDTEQREIATIKSNLQKRLSSIKSDSKEEQELRKLLTENAEKEIEDIRQKYYDIENKNKIDKQKALWEKVRQNEQDNFEQLIKENEDINNRITLNAIQELENREITKKEYEDRILQITIDTLKREIEIRKKYGKETTNLEIELSERRIEQAEREKNKVNEEFQEMYDTVQKYVNGIMTSVTAIFDATNSILQSQLDNANEKYESITKKYDEVVSKREESESRLQDLEERAKNARGGRALILQEQINSEMIANQQLANQEKQLAKEKEKQENEIAKKERQMKKAELGQNIVQGVSNTALGVTKALEWGFPLGPIFAAIIGAAGAVQVSLMTSQLAKLEDGGLLNGKRHSQGGMRVEGTNIEVEGGEYVVNRDSTNKNLGLIKYINSQRRTLGPNDLNSFFSKSSQVFESPFKKMFEAGGQLPAIENSVMIDNDALVAAIQSIKIEPKVSVSDINEAQNNVVSVDEWTGM